MNNSTLTMSGKILLILLFVSATSFSQNLLRNGDFEEIHDTLSGTYCANVAATDWYRVNSVDVYLNPTEKSGPRMRAESGKNYIGLAGFLATYTNYREYYVGTLQRATLKNKPYLINLYYALADNSSYICTDLHVFFVDSLEENLKTGFYKMFVTDTLPIPLKKNIQEEKWQYFTDTIYSTEVSRYLGVGNLLDDKRIKVYKRNKRNTPHTYFYFDNISVTPLFEDTQDTFINIINKDTIQKTEDSIRSFKNIIFESNSSIVNENFLPKIEFIAQYLNKTSYKIMLKGFTDNVGSEQYNLSLSEKRVLSIRQVLIDNQVDPAKIQTSYFGESNSLNQNTFENDRLENRRVEILLIK